MKWLGLTTLILLAACIGEDETETVMPGSKTCDPAAFEFLIGQPKESLNGVLTPKTLRVLGENAAMTMDHQPERLNVFHDESGKITKVSCG
ncbi:Peptidase inhibitor I78 family protein [Shimia gijangensis]|uniref:Peptidase inhibitor I78 family protein n=1 Tax=Shimia gijangensis TaxID=1470563 RepID=A0A1M6JIV9_9RHOB|nr:I78 family peptidase inhibitor [Shimia gijangensis]SHJ46668.1 Peptidase inhibitor I78 family protein [Shimia gijangensis]